MAFGGVDGGDPGETVGVCVTVGCPGVAGVGDDDDVAGGGAGAAGTIGRKGLSLSAKGGSSTRGDSECCDMVML